jgi:2'-5' RNA ligase
MRESKVTRTAASGDSALIVVVPEVLSREIAAWRRAYDPNHRAIPPHITVVYPPFVPVDKWPQARAGLASRIRQFEPFEVVFRELATFEGPPAVLWLRPEDGGILSRLNAAIAELMPEYVAALLFEYVPHLTIGFFASGEELEAARHAVDASLPPLRFRVEALAYTVFDAQGSWHKYDEVLLGSHQGSNSGGHSGSDD